ncbi:hypothetical protein EDB83DRAFT_2524439 [Lactarius deliciosus]|nr:hypothetical protein EDB83DRAFT_2524439 [Lactarius deliciosus]
MCSTAHLELSADACAPHVALVTTLALHSRISRYLQTRCPTHSLTFFDHLLAAPARARLTPHAPPFHWSSLCPSATPCRDQQQPRHRGRSRSQPSALPRDATHYQHTGLILVLTPDMGVRAHGPLLGALGNTGAGLETPELSFKDISDEVSLRAPYKQVGSLLLNVQALRTLRLRTVTTEAAQAEEGPSHLAL